MRLFNLLVVLMLVLVAPATITSCLQNVCASTDTAIVASTLQQAQGGAGTATVAADTVITPVAQLVATPDAKAEEFFSWQNIVIVALGIFSTLFAALWNRARNVILAIDEALADGRVNRTELDKILKAWKA